MNYADVILPLPLEGTFTYYVPTAYRQTIAVGMRVIVPVGKSKRYIGIVSRLHNDKPQFQCREIASLPDTYPLVLGQQLKLWQWMADYYLCPLGDVYKAAMPIPLRSMERMRTKTERWVQLAPTLQTEDDLHAALDAQRRAPLRRRLLETFICLAMEGRDGRGERITGAPGDTSYISLAEDARGKTTPFPLTSVPVELLLNEANATTTALNNMVKQGLFVTFEKECYDTPSVSVSSAAPLIAPLSPLSEAQQAAYDDILRQHRDKQVVLLRGVTSSGKTEIYTHLIADTLLQGGQVLYLLPEIALTTQITQRLQQVFGERLGVYHSRYTEQQRADIWRRQCSETPYGIILGARSAVLLPFQNLQLVIVDEEHDANLHQSDPSPRYHARNMAIMMAYIKERASSSLSSPLVLLGSATPSAESYHNARTGKYGYVELLTRYKDLPLPHTIVVDIKDLYHRKMMRGMFSPQLLEAIQTTLAQHRQVIVFQNRRGYAPVMECTDCGWTPRCTQCDIPLTLHRRTNSLTCHTCGTLYRIPNLCPQCNGRHIVTHGFGTEKVEDVLSRRFPKATILRMDLDNTRSRHAHQRMIEQFAHQQAQILVGTQMVTKGLDFDGVDVVAIVSADSLLTMPDFRATERAFAMMMQVSGRAGRQQGQGRVFLQTRQPETEVIQRVVDNDYTGFMHTLLQERLAFSYPPYAQLIYIYVRHRSETSAEQAADDMAATLRQQLQCHVLGPDKPTAARIRQEHIRKIVVKYTHSTSRKHLYQCLRQARKAILDKPAYRSATIYFEVDP